MNLILFQMDVLTASLNGEVEEEIYDYRKNLWILWILVCVSVALFPLVLLTYNSLII